MFKTASDEDRRAQVGIGTLIMFVAMVLIAVVAAGVLVNTAGVLQSQAEATGQESTAEVSNTLEVYTSVGTLDENGHIETVDMTVSLGPGSNPIDLGNIVIDYLGPNDHAYVKGEHVAVDGSEGTVLEDGSDRGTITLELEEKAQPLEPGDGAAITIITNDGAQISQELIVPTTLDGEAGEKIRL
ncbi:archaellin/type IV pilin N-terminal domain-containing protein [Halostagnicola sp. A-GB9-2]|uniref:archaellin/type IV pilin N-terminal domain-containing protein n=1 Tax=Halostagnicola sp. A-GB9-2 TaxID=3048066 RepID=UPI0024BF6014|nr:archaellin/type IV pilin N-terminal domain-containing protein [Halostagnicola sp. A-GB9-2]MDJ1432161.1 flagellin A2 [Halostagnicola sp. A-GB9-2]